MTTRDIDTPTTLGDSQQSESMVTNSSDAQTTAASQQSSPQLADKTNNENFYNFLRGEYSSAELKI